VIQGTTTTYNYTYDNAGRLKQVKKNGAVTATYYYDPNGNRDSIVTPGATTRGTYDAQDRMLTYGTSQYVYTKSGYLKYKITSPDTTTYTYDNFGNLTSAKLPGNTTVTYVIDASSRRIGRKVNGAWSSNKYRGRNPFGMML